MTTEILALDEISASQSQKEVAHNTALRKLEGRLVRALSRTTATPPTAPAAGDSYIVATSATDAWAGQDGKIAHFYGGTWNFWQPIEGIRLWVCDEDKTYAFNGAAWVISGGGVQTVNAKSPDASGGVTLTYADVGADALGAASSAVATHAGASDPHPQYLTQSEGDGRYALSGSAGAANGYATLDSAGKLQTAQLPDLAIIKYLGTVANQAAMLALNGESGDWCIRSDDSKVYVITGNDPTQAGSWTPLSYPVATNGTVTSVDLSVPGLLYTVSGNPVTTSGTLTFTLKTQVKNTFLAGPVSGADAAPTMRQLTQADLPAQPFDMTAFYPGVPASSAIVTRAPVARAVVFAANFSGSVGIARVAATASTAFDVRKNGTSIGTITFAAGANAATFSTTSGAALTLAAGDYLSIYAPATPDATLADVGFVLAGTR